MFGAVGDAVHLQYVSIMSCDIVTLSWVALGRDQLNLWERGTEKRGGWRGGGTSYVKYQRRIILYSIMHY